MKKKKGDERRFKRMYLAGGLLIAAVLGIGLMAFVFYETPAEQFARERAAWEEEGSVAYYMMIEEETGWYGLRLHMTVAESNVLNMQAECFPSGMMGPDCFLNRVSPRDYRIDNLFDLLQRTHSLTRVEFDSETHHPTLISIDDPDLMDDQRTLRVVDLTVLPDDYSASGAGMVAISPSQADIEWATQIAIATATARERYTATERDATTTSRVSAEMTVTKIARDIITATAGSSSSQATPVATPTAAQRIQNVSLNPVEPEGNLEAALDAAEATWNARDSSSYTITLEDIGVWNGMELTLYVENGRVNRVEATCRRGYMPGNPCTVWDITPSDYTVPGLFEEARKAISVQSDSNIVLQSDIDPVLELDARQRIPVVIRYDDEQTTDDAWHIRVTRFRVYE